MLLRNKNEDLPLGSIPRERVPANEAGSILSMKELMAVVATQGKGLF